MAKITVGPVIGKVTDTTARIAIEIDADAHVRCIAQDLGGNTVEAELDLTASRFTAFEVTGLQPATKYDVSYEGADGAISGSFTTFAAQPSKMNVGVVSCNFASRIDDQDQWKDLRNRYVNNGELDLLLHVGDQIYGDQAFLDSMVLLDGQTTGNSHQDAEIMDNYRKLYRTTWNHPPTRDVLARIPNLMIWDDHEIRDDWGSRSADYDPETAEHHIGRLAQKVFREYQRQLWDDNLSAASGFEDHFHVWGPIGVLFVDQRGGRSFERDATRPYLGQPQWDRIVHHLNPGGAFDQVRALIVVTSVPLVYLGDSTTNGGSGVVDDLQDHWAYGVHRKEQQEMLRALRYWKYDGGGERELLVVGGDVHIGCHTKIKHDKKTIFKQLITSPITNKPPNFFAFTALKAALEIEENLGSNYSFEHYDYTRQRNFGVIIVRVPDTGIPIVSGGLEYA